MRTNRAKLKPPSLLLPSCPLFTPTHIVLGRTREYRACPSSDITNVHKFYIESVRVIHGGALCVSGVESACDKSTKEKKREKRKTAYSVFVNSFLLVSLLS